MLSSNGDSTQPCRSSRVTSNHSECSPSSVRTPAYMPSWNWREHLGWCTEAYEHVPYKLVALGRQSHTLLQVDEASTWTKGFFLVRVLLAVGARQAAYPLLFLGEDSALFAAAAKARRDDFQQYDIPCLHGRQVITTTAVVYRNGWICTKNQLQ